MINERCKRLLNYLIDTKHPVTIKKLSNQLGVSARTIRYDLDKIDMWLDEQHFLELIRKPKSGISLDKYDSNLKDALTRNNIYTYIMSPQERTNFILSILFSSVEPVNLKTISDRLDVSISTISNDLKNVKSWLKEYYIKLISKPNYGLVLEADEKKLRKAYMELVYEVMGQNIISADYYSSKHDLINWMHEHYYCFSDFEKLSEDVLTSVINSIKMIEKEERVHFTDSSFTKLLLYLTIMIIRVKKGAVVNFEPNEISILVSQKEYRIAQIAFDYIENNLKLRFNLNETANLTLNILSSKIMAFTENKNMDSLILEGNLSVDALSVSGQVIHEAQKLLNINLDNDKDLLLNLALHIKPLLYRLSFNLPCEKNPLLLDIKNSFPDIYNTVQNVVGKILYNKTNKEIEEDEIGYVTMHLGAAILKKMKEEYKNINVAIVCGTGIGVADMLSSRINILFSNINISKIFSYREFLENIGNKEYDVLLSTVPLDDLGVKYILVSPLLTNNDIERLKEYLMLKPQNIDLKGYIETTLNIISNIMNLSEDKKLQLQMELLKALPKQASTVVVRKNIPPSLKELLLEESIMLKVKANDWREAIDCAGSLLVKQNFIDKKYVKSMIRYKEKLGSYIVIDKGIALPHAMPQDGVSRPCFSMITLKDPVEFGHSENDPVDIVIVLATTNNWVHIQALTELMLVLNCTSAVKSIREAVYPGEIINLLQ